MTKCMGEVGSDGKLPREDEEPTSGIAVRENYIGLVSMAKCMGEVGSDGELPREDEEPTSGIESSTEFYTPTMSVSSATISTPSSSCSAYQSSRIDSLRESRSAYQSAVEFEIAASKSHWTEWNSDGDETDCSLEDNLQHFESLQLDYRWGHHDRAYFEKHDMVVGKKLAEGGQAEIYEATLVGFGRSLVVKVFKEGSSVRSLERQWPPELLAKWKRNKATFSIFRNPLLLIDGAILLNDERFNNRFAFVMRRAWGDLRKHIDLQMLNRKHKQKRGRAPYSTNKALSLMWRIAHDMAWLHEQGILHRDLKASNVLIWMDSVFSEVGQFHGRVADFECSVGVVGTRFWRAPEILQQLKDGVSMSKVVFTTKADVYSFGMTCYEIVTGCTPFEDLLWQNYDHVLSGNQLALPVDLEMLVQKMIRSCWQLDPPKRPSFSEILSEFKPFEDRMEVDYFYL